MRRIIIAVVVTLVLSISFVHAADGWATNRPATFTVSEREGALGECGCLYAMIGTVHEDGQPDRVEHYFLSVEEYLDVETGRTYQIVLHHDWGSTADYVESVGGAVPVPG